MRILLFHQYYLEPEDPGGSRWNEFARIWQAKGHQITVIAGMVHAYRSRKKDVFKGKFHCYRVEDGIPVHRTHVSGYYNHGFTGRLWGYFSFAVSSLWAAIFKVKGSFDVVISSSPPLFLGIPAYLVSAFKRIPLVFEIRDLWPESAVDLGIVSNRWMIRSAYALERFLCRRSALVTVVTPGIGQRMIQKYPWLTSRVVTIPNGVDFSRVEESLRGFDREAFRRRLKFDRYFVMIYVGAHGAANHLGQVLEVAKRAEGTDLLFVLIGEGPEKSSLSEKARVARLQNVRFLDSVPKQEVFRYISAADVGLTMLRKCPAFFTVYSNKTFDYMACKKPVINTIDGMSRQLIETASAGVFVEPDDWEGIISAVGNYRENPDRAREEGENGYVFVKTNFAREVLAEQYLHAIIRKINPR